MTDEEITEGNKLIAGFMKMELEVADYGGFLFYKWKNADHKFIWHSKHPPPYHRSWCWLMPVLSKIEQHGCIVEIWLSNATGCRIVRVASPVLEFVREANKRIEAPYIAAIEFIKWYNENLKK